MDRQNAGCYRLEVKMFEYWDENVQVYFVLVANL